MTRSLLALAALATAATVGLGGSPAIAAQAPLEMGVGYGDSSGDFSAEGLTSWSVGVFQDRSGVWRASVLRTVARRDAATGTFHMTTDQTAGRGALPLPAGAVQVSDNGHEVTVDAVLPIVTTVSTSSFAGSTSESTQSTTTLSGTWRLAGGSTDDHFRGGGTSFTMTPAYYGCESADHYEDTTRRAAAAMTVLGQTLVVEPGTDKDRTDEATVSTYRLRGTENC